MTIDWSKAPEGATHLTLPNGPNRRPVFWRVADGIAREAWPMENDFSVVRDHFRYGADGCASFVDWLAIPKPAPWNGEGLPPVGTVCEFQFLEESNQFKAELLHGHKVTVIAHYAGVTGRMVAAFTFDYEGGNARDVESATEAHFRPIRTPEQIAEDEKRAGIESIVEAFRHTVGPCTHLLPYSTAERLYEIGVRLQVSQ